MHKTLGFVLIAFGLTACSVGTSPTDIAERAARADVDKAALFGGQEEVTKPITLYEAIAAAAVGQSFRHCGIELPALGRFDVAVCIADIKIIRRRFDFRPPEQL